MRARRLRPHRRGVVPHRPTRTPREPRLRGRPRTALACSTEPAAIAGGCHWPVSELRRRRAAVARAAHAGRPRRRTQSRFDVVLGSRRHAPVARRGATAAASADRLGPAVWYDTVFRDWVVQLPWIGPGDGAILPLEIRWFDALPRRRVPRRRRSRLLRRRLRAAADGLANRSPAMASPTGAPAPGSGTVDRAGVDARPVRLHRTPLAVRALAARGVARLVRGEPGAFALTGNWAGGGAIVGCNPLMTADADCGPVRADRRAADGRRQRSRWARAARTAASGEAVGGGWFGWFGYRLGRRIEVLPETGRPDRSRSPSSRSPTTTICCASTRTGGGGSRHLSATGVRRGVDGRRARLTALLHAGPTEQSRVRPAATAVAERRRRRTSPRRDR